MSGRVLVLMALVACLAGPAAAWPFGDSEEEQAAEVATRVAEALREPNRLIVQAQEATQKGDVEEAIRLFRRAQMLLEQTEASNPKVTGNVSSPIQFSNGTAKPKAPETATTNARTFNARYISHHLNNKIQLPEYPNPY